MGKKVNNEVCIIGVGRFSLNLIKILSEANMHIIAIDTDENTVTEIVELVDVAIRGDATSAKLLKDNGIHKMDKIILGMGHNIQASLLTATTLIELGATNIYAKATTDTHEKILRQVGVRHIVKPEAVAAKKMATQLLNPIYDEGATDFEVDVYDDDLSIAKVNMVNPDYLNMEIMKLGLPVEQANIILVNRKGKKILPYGKLKLLDGDRINLLGEHQTVYQ
jgi:trk system potassium uptake protein TrkA